MANTDATTSGILKQVWFGDPASSNFFYRPGRISTLLALPGTGEPSGEPMYFLQQVNARLLASYPAASVFEFRVTESGAISKIQFFAPNAITEDAIFDLNLGDTRSDSETIFPDQNERPKILSGDFSVEKVVNVAVAEGQLISIDIDEADEPLKLLAVTITIER